MTNSSSSENQSYLEFQNSKGHILYTVGKLKKLSTTFIQTILTDSVVKLVETGHNQTVPEFQTA